MLALVSGKDLARFFQDLKLVKIRLTKPHQADQAKQKKPVMTTGFFSNID